MVTLLTVFSYVKKYWALFALVAGFVVFEIMLQQKQTDFAKLLDDINKKHQAELDAIQRAHDVEDKQHAENQAKMKAQLAAIEKQYAAAEKMLDDSKKAEIKQILTDTQDDPEALAQKLAAATGFTVMLP